MIAGRPAATIALHHRRQVQTVDHFDDKPCEMLLGKPFIERRRKQKPRRAVKLPEIAHQAHLASESIAPTYLVRHSSAKSDRLRTSLGASGGLLAVGGVGALGLGDDACALGGSGDSCNSPASTSAR